MIIVPAILTDDRGELERQVKICEQFTDYAQIDIMDGHFVHNRSVGWQDLSSIETTLSYEIHLMVTHPADEVDHFSRISGVKRIYCHFETNWQAAAEKIKAKGLEFGLALNPETEIPHLDHGLLNQIDSIMLMTVNPGAQGQNFIPHVLPKARHAKSLHSGIIVAVDGGVRLDNIEQVVRAGVEQVCVGAAIMAADDPAAEYRKFLEASGQLP